MLPVLLAYASLLLARSRLHTFVQMSNTAVHIYKYMEAFVRMYRMWFSSVGVAACTRRSYGDFRFVFHATHVRSRA